MRHIQKWEYKYLYRRRGLKPSSGGYVDAMPWNPDVTFAEIQALGEEGWELVAVACLSSYGGWISTELLYEEPMPNAVPKTSGPVVGGVTTDQTFYFKRPKQ